LTGPSRPIRDASTLAATSPREGAGRLRWGAGRAGRAPRGGRRSGGRRRGATAGNVPFLVKQVTEADIPLSFTSFNLGV